MFVSTWFRMRSRRDVALFVGGLFAVAVLLALLLPWLRADPPRGLTGSQSPYADEGLYNLAARNFAMFGSFGRTGQFLQLTNSGYTFVNALVFSVTGPSIVVARTVSVLSVCAMVLLALWGLARPIGVSAAVVVAACLGGNQLILAYGHIGIVEPFELMVLVGAFVAMTRALERERWVLGVVSGVLLAIAVAAKISGLLAIPGLIGVPILGALLERNRRRLYPPLVAVATFLVLAGLWILAVALPNRADLHAGMQTLNGTADYPHSFGGVVSRLSAWVTHPGASDQVMRWTRPLLLACIVGVICCVLLWRRCSPMHRYVAASGLIWAAVAWGVAAAGSYNPNRYFLVAVPGLALAAGPGLGVAVDWATHRIDRWSVVAACGLAALVATPGIVAYLKLESPVFGTHQLERDQRAIAAVLPRNAVVYGVYSADLAFSDRVRMVVPWPPSHLHVVAPVERYGVRYVMFDVSRYASPSLDPAIVKAVTQEPGVRLERPMVEVQWGPHTLALFHLSTVGAIEPKPVAAYPRP